MDPMQKVKAINEIVRRRLSILHMIQSTTKSLNSRNVFRFSAEDIECPKRLVELLRVSRFRLACDASTDNHVFLVSPNLAEDKNLLTDFLQIHVKRIDLFSDDFIVAVPKYFIESGDEWEMVKLPIGLRPCEVEHMITVYSHCFTMLEEFTVKLINIGVESVTVPGEPCCYALDRSEQFVGFIIDSLEAINSLPVKQFGVKELNDVWKSAITFWDIVDMFRSVVANSIQSDLWEQFKVSFNRATLTLLRFSCMNIRMNYLEPFTWASEILERLTNLLAESDEACIKKVIGIQELVSIYNEFQQQWSQIEHYATRQWEKCLVFRNDISYLQKAAYKLERSLWNASHFIPGVKPLGKVSENFLLNFLITTNVPIIDFAYSKKLTLVSLLKRKQWVETYLCYDMEKKHFLVVKEIRLVKSAKTVIQNINLLERYDKLLKYRHPSLAKYYYTEVHGDSLFIAMEHFGSSLINFLSENGQIEDEFLFRSFCIKILTCLAYLHNRGIAHGDIQPGNILQDSKGNFKFVDYGDVNRQFKTEMSKVDMSYFAGTVPYMAPEVVLHHNSYDGIKADIWSFGCLLIQLVTGFRPWHELEHDYAIIFRLGATKFLPEALLNLPLSHQGSEFIKSCLDHNPDTRPTVNDLLTSEYLTYEHVPRPRILSI